MPAPAVTVTETRFATLKAKLRELFELDKSDLDFGIYRIMAAKNREVTEFLDRQLRDAVRATLAEHGAGAVDQVEAEIAKARKAAEDAGFNPDESPKVKELEAKRASAGGASAADLEADIYNHLFNFFSRYYDEGDFISKRRYKGNTYAIPYSGEEVVLHWANKDQYYIKSGEWHKDYRFRLPGDKTVHFKLVEATQETGNNKEPDDAKRRYILDAEQPIEFTAGELTLRFQFRVPTPAEIERAGDGAVAIWGGNYARSTKGDQREQFCADAEKRCREALSPSSGSAGEGRGGGAAALAGTWLTRISQQSSTESKPLRTILGKHLDHFTARNTFDYFIHKDLGGFLNRELDLYVKNEVVRLDDLETLPADHLQRMQGRVKAIRRVAGRIIEFLAAIENFQKKMWLKKKFVLETNWLVTVDRITPRLRDIVAANEAQWREWEALGFKPEETGETRLFAGAQWGTKEYLNAFDKLVVDTHLFDRHFKYALLANDSVLHGMRGVEEASTGLLIHSENSQALSLLCAASLSSIRFVYIDPPYNTGGDGFMFRDSYPHSTWLAMMARLLATTVPLLQAKGILYGSIDANERHSFQTALNLTFGDQNRVEEIIWVQNSHKNQSPTFSTVHEYVQVYARRISEVKRDSRMLREVKPGYIEVMDVLRSFATKYSPVLEIEQAVQALYAQHKAEAQLAISDGLQTDDDWKGIYMYSNVEYRDADGRYVAEEDARSTNASVWLWREDNSAMPSVKEDSQKSEFRDPSDPTFRFYTPIHPTTGKPCPHPKTGWRWPFAVAGNQKNTFSDLAADHRIAWGENEQKVPQVKRFLHEVETNVSKSVVADFTDGEKELAHLFGRSRAFSNPKPTTLVKRFLLQAASEGGWCLDYFAGSGTTGHSIINLNREDNGHRKLILVELADHFHTILKPRIAKVIYSPDWKDGKAQSHDKGISALVKYFALESYEDALNNLPSPGGELLAGRSAEERDSLIAYSLDLELGPHLLDLDAFRDPWNYFINAQLAGEAEISRHRVDLVETFNYLIGLRVKAYGPIEQYSADFDRRNHADGLGALKVRGRLRRDPEGHFVFQRVEGELNDGNDTRVLVVWRKLTDDPEKDAAVLEAWMDRHRQATTERSEFRDYHTIFINGPITLPQPTQEIRTVLPLEQTFKDRMFEDTEGAGL